MKSRPNLIASEAEAVAAPRPYRHKISTLSHVHLNAASAAILRDLNEFGIAMQTVVPLTLNQEITLRFDLPASRVRIDAAGRIVWTDSWGQAGVQFVNLPQRSERLLKEWILTQILSSVYLFAPGEAGVVHGNRAEGANELLFSASPRPAIPLEPEPTIPQVSKVRPRNLCLFWYPRALSFRAFSKAMDILILMCAILLFAVMSMFMTDFLPSWPITLVLSIGVAAIFVAVYWFLFRFWFSSTPGEHLAGMAGLELGSDCLKEEDQARFR
jgi:hypothetical protein